MHRPRLLSAAACLVLAGIGLAGCAELPFMHPQRAYIVFFAPFKTNLNPPGIAVVAQAAHEAKIDLLSPVTITGAADTVGSTPANIALSNERAAAVAAQLVADGIAPARITTRGIGPVGSPPDSKQAARTATITIGTAQTPE
jgi:hypothetical protein